MLGPYRTRDTNYDASSETEAKVDDDYYDYDLSIEEKRSPKPTEEEITWAKTCGVDLAAATTEADDQRKSKYVVDKSKYVDHTTIHYLKKANPSVEEVGIARGLIKILRRGGKS